MRRLKVALLLLSTAAACRAETYDAHSLAVELRKLSGEIARDKKSSIERSLPDAWIVESKDGAYPISTRPLRRLAGASGNTDAARVWLDQLAEQLDAFEEAPSRSDAAAQRRLNEILATREFSGIRPPTPWELFRERVNRAIGDFFRWLFSLIAAHSIGGQVLAWIAAIAAIGFLLFLLFKPLRRPARLASEDHAAAATRGWEEWARTAREAAARGNLREAIHAAYWCGVARLQDTGALPADGAHTPREYLRLARQRNAGLISLTSTLERVWYAGRAATPEDLRESFAQLEAMGCRLD